MMKTDWVILAEICQEKHVQMEIMIYPDKHKDQLSCGKRAQALKEAYRRGVKVGSLTTLCPLTERRMREIVGNPEPQDQRAVNGLALELPFAATANQRKTSDPLP